jgi:lysylphosphatidylglycerol synthetase-like protein (DUF2156 family)
MVIGEAIHHWAAAVFVLCPLDHVDYHRLEIGFDCMHQHAVQQQSVGWTAVSAAVAELLTSLVCLVSTLMAQPTTQSCESAVSAICYCLCLC